MTMSYPTESLHNVCDEASPSYSDGIWSRHSFIPVAADEVDRLDVVSVDVGILSVLSHGFVSAREI